MITVYQICTTAEGVTIIEAETKSEERANQLLALLKEKGNQLGMTDAFIQKRYLLD